MGSTDTKKATYEMQHPFTTRNKKLISEKSIADIVNVKN